jgi:hypothetical protein
MTDKPQNNSQQYVDFISKQVRSGQIPGKPPGESKPEEKK